jgi:hypothetical protein
MFFYVFEISIKFGVFLHGLTKECNTINIGTVGTKVCAVHLELIFMYRYGTVYSLLVYIIIMHVLILHRETVIIPTQLHARPPPRAFITVTCI